MESQRSNKVDNLIAALLALTPVLTQYYFSFAKGISLFDWAILLALGISLLSKIGRINLKADLLLLLFSGYTILHTLVISLFNNSSDISGELHIGIYYLVIAIVVDNIEDKDRLGLYIRNIAIFSTVFLFVQVIVYRITGRYISGTISFLGHNEVVDLYSRSMNSYFQINMRPRSIFVEPSHYGVYVAIALAMLLSKRQNKRSYIIEALLTMGLFASLSTTGIVLGAGIWIFYGLRNMSTHMPKRRFALTLFIGLIIIVCAVVYLNNSPWLQIVLQRTFGFGGNYKTSALGNRIGNIIPAITQNRTVLMAIFGAGIPEINYFIPEFVKSYLTFGITGLILFIACIIHRYKNVNNAYLFVFIALAIATIGALWMSAFSVFYFACLKVSQDAGNAE